MSIPAPPGGWPNKIRPPVHFANSQWVVTNFGLECCEPGIRYRIVGEKVNERRKGTNLYDWPLHMTDKSWVRMDDFNAAFDFALRHFRHR